MSRGAKSVKRIMRAARRRKDPTPTWPVMGGISREPGLVHYYSGDPPKFIDPQSYDAWVGQVVNIETPPQTREDVVNLIERWWTTFKTGGREA